MAFQVLDHTFSVRPGGETSTLSFAFLSQQTLLVRGVSEPRLQPSSTERGDRQTANTDTPGQRDDPAGRLEQFGEIQIRKLTL